ncbi:haloacid dehalogenase-like hydrolase [Metamycoplasma cloacale]|uniref:HAD-IIB family hydrolase n=1 Tax=Metamycoplasma cloacale TaxID=92401 RepID=A0A2Z4LMV7_9BACT|nr:HAD-IIB family hydrolase [Metamycoplasma cloacale]AWX42984.1 HAD-IIB family hydrolase [Metamycoplasma cloacale]VEU79192.1 haloacid dehalogenase-like hydrolase [Metamycoplasma cloacale]
MEEKTINNKKLIIFSDVDGTIYKNFNLLKETIEDVRFINENNGDFNICTGNPCFDRMNWLSNELQAKYVLGSSGSQIYDVVNEKIIYSEHIDKKILKDIIDIASKHQFQILFWDNEQYFYLLDKDWNDSLFTYHFKNEEIRKTFPKKYNNESINPVKIEIYPYDHDNEEQLQEINKLIDNINGVSKTLTNCNIEILPNNLDKASAVVWMMNNVYNNDETKIDEIMTIGDGYNDITMLKLTQYSYAMANAYNEVLKTAKYYTSSVEQNGLGEAILDYAYRLKHLYKKYMLHNIKEK